MGNYLQCHHANEIPWQLPSLCAQVQFLAGCSTSFDFSPPCSSYCPFCQMHLRITMEPFPLSVFRLLRKLGSGRTRTPAWRVGLYLSENTTWEFPDSTTEGALQSKEKYFPGSEFWEEPIMEVCFFLLVFKDAGSLTELLLLGSLTFTLSWCLRPGALQFWDED